MYNTLNVGLEQFTYNKKDRSLSAKMKEVTGSYIFPFKMIITSHHTGRSIEFIQVKEGDSLFDYDFYDGEMMYYRPVNFCGKIDYVFLSNS